MIAPVATLVFVALICGYDQESDRYTRECGSFETPAIDAADCRRLAAWLRATSPANVRVIATECFRERRSSE